MKKILKYKKAGISKASEAQNMPTSGESLGLITPIPQKM